MHEFQVHRPFDTPRSYQLKIGDEAIEAPMVCKKHLLPLKWHFEKYLYMGFRATLNF